jgi:putative exosortase-associated protein (TIGR04073 family)
MKKFFITAMAAILIMGIGCWSFAYETDFDDLNQANRNLPSWKFGRGIVNMLSFPHELLSNVANGAIQGAKTGAYYDGLYGYMAGSLNGFIAGTSAGVYQGMRRVTTGALEVLTFWKPEYGPTIDPLYGTHNQAFTHRDYNNPENYWYNGPDY